MPPRYQLYPEEYMLCLETKRHMLRTGKVFLKKYAENPGGFVETASVLPPAPIKAPVQLPLPPTPEVQPNIVHIGNPLPEPPKPEIDHEKEQMAARVRELIKEELRLNPKPYENKDASELSKSFRAMLIERLAPQEPNQPHVNSRAKPVKAPKKPVKFSLRKPVTSDDDDDDQSVSESEF